jgi:hypothetical protein
VAEHRPSRIHHDLRRGGGDPIVIITAIGVRAVVGGGHDRRLYVAGEILNRLIFGDSVGIT